MELKREEIKKKEQTRGLLNKNIRGKKGLMVHYSSIKQKVSRNRVE